MSTTPPGPYAVAEFETTADYPPTSPASPVDTWVKPTRGKKSAGKGSSDKHSSGDERMRAYREEVRALRESVAALTNHRDQLQVDDTMRAAKLQVIEQLQQTKDDQYAHQERELDACKEEIAALRENLAAVTTSRDRLQTDLSALSSKLERIEEPQSEVELHRELAEREARIAELTEEMSARAQQHFLDHAELEDLKTRLERAQKRDRQASNPADSERERVHRDQALARHREDLTDLQRQVARQCEALQRAEARRQVFESMLREREELIDERDARLRTMQKEADAQRKDHGVALERANKQLAQALARGGERHFGESFQSVESPEAVSAAEVMPVILGPGQQQRIDTLEAQLAEGREVLGLVQQELKAAKDSIQSLRDQLVEAESRAREVLRSPQPAVAVREQPQSEVATQVPSARSGQRLLVRTDGDAGIVHQLTRRTTIGRIPVNDLCVDSESISRHHAVVLVTDSGTAIEDLNSTNGVYVNGVRVQRQQLLEGDLVTIGKVSFRYVVKPDAD